MSYLLGIESVLPAGRRTNDDLVRHNPAWDSDAIYAKTGIRCRAVASAEQTAADLGYQAAEALIDGLEYDRDTIDTLLFCTQSPEYCLPASACLLQQRLNLSTNCGAFDINLGCSAFTYGIWMAKALLDSGASRSVLVITGDTMTKYCNIHDGVTAPLFSDGAAAAIISASPDGAIARFGPSVVGTDGRGAQHLIVRAGGARVPKSEKTSQVYRDENGYERSDEHVFMNGPAVYFFTLSRVPEAIQKLLGRVDVALDQIDLFLFHQANRLMLETLGQKMGIPADKMPVEMEEVGNTSGASLPILICQCMRRGLLRPRQRCVLVGFGVGFSWAITYMEWIGANDRPSK